MRGYSTSGPIIIGVVVAIDVRVVIVVDAQDKHPLSSPTTIHSSLSLQDVRQKGYQLL